MTLTQLAYIVALDEERHFGRAAEQCHVSQPTLSAQIKKLEDELGVDIFDRSYSPVEPTPTGRKILRQARRVLTERSAIMALVLEDSERIEGELRLGILPTLAAYVVPLIARPLRERYPGIELNVRELTTEHILDFLATDRLDAGLIATTERRPGLATIPVFREPFVAYVGHEHRLSIRTEIAPGDLAIDEIWLLSEGHCFRDQVFQLCEQDVRVDTRRTIRFESGSLETLCNLVDRVGGMTLLPYLATLYMDTPAVTRVRRFESPAPHRDVRMIHRTGGLRQALVQAATEVIDGVAGPLLEKAEDCIPAIGRAR